MAKISTLDKAIDQLEQEIQILALAVAKLKQQRETKPVKMRIAKPRGAETQ